MSKEPKVQEADEDEKVMLEMLAKRDEQIKEADRQIDQWQKQVCATRSQREYLIRARSRLRKSLGIVQHREKVKEDA